MFNKNVVVKSFFLLSFLSAFVLMAPVVGLAKSKTQIDLAVDLALQNFRARVSSSEDLLKDAKAVLVMPGVIKGGFWVGAEYGEGALLIQEDIFDYYNIVSGSFGFQFGAQKKDIFLLFMNDEAFRNFRAGEGWEIGADGSVALLTVGAEGSIDTTKTNQPVIGFVLGQKGFMVDVSLEGSKFSRIKPKD